MTGKKNLTDEDDDEGLAGALVPAGPRPKPPRVAVGARFREVRRKMVRPVEDKMLRGPRDFERAQDEVDGGSLGAGD